MKNKKKIVGLTRNVRTQKKVKKPLDVAISEILVQYKDSNFLDIRENLDIDFKNVFKKYPEFKYDGYQTQLGCLEDISIIYTKTGEQIG